MYKVSQNQMGLFQPESQTNYKTNRVLKIPTLPNKNL